MFQDEIFQINAYVATLRHEDEHQCLWDVRKPDMEGSRSREISVEKSSNLVSCKYEKGTEVVSKHLLLAKDELVVLRSSRKPCPASGIEMRISHGSQHSFKESLQVRAKGCGKRLKGGKEKASKKSRNCHGYGLAGQSHDKRNCPKLLNMYVYAYWTQRAYARECRSKLQALSDLFLISEQRKETISYEISVQMIEIYNDQVRDLLVTDGLNKTFPFERKLSTTLLFPITSLIPN
ncbi:hypothetical protein RHSIM_Rhsim03G0118800 [Rhododendron simsii]|uniref:Kinesin motor domain-containing protein n=1 Tax=Rhododendron simsii TaxID=118357 RepID=A0A834LVA1_RHOSS|nr:hypothetical protein RHSIM_Rhsim03G0118800 [Rhododendron simsii]